MPYIYAETRAGNTVLVEKYYSSRYKKKGIERSVNQSKTSEKQEKVNLRKEIRKLTLKLNANFGYGDYHLVLDYMPSFRPADTEQAKEDRGKFIRKLRTLYRREGKELKYVIVTEFGKKGALHHHLVINHGISTVQIQDLWKKGRVHFNPLDDTGEYSQLASYMLKNRKYWKQQGGKGKQYSCSRNLVTPVTEKHIIRRSEGYYEKPRGRKGYYVALDSVYNDIREDGYPYLSYILVRENGKRGP